MPAILTFINFLLLALMDQRQHEIPVLSEDDDPLLRGLPPTNCCPVDFETAMRYVFYAAFVLYIAYVIIMWTFSLV